MGTLWQDLRYGARTLLKQPTFTVVALLTLALGIGANSAIFTVINAVLLRPLDLNKPEQLVRLYETLPAGGFGSVSYANLVDWREQSDSFTAIAAFQLSGYSLQGQDRAEHIIAANVSTNFFDVIESPPMMGRTFREGEDQTGAARVAALTYHLWQRNFAGDRDIVGKDIQLGGESYTVIGVMPRGFTYPSVYTSRMVGLWTPLVVSDNQRTNRGNHAFNTVARLKPGVSFEQAQEQMSVIGSRLEQQYPNQQTGRNIRVNLVQEEITQAVRPSLHILWGAVGFVLLIACVNVANLLLARATGRRREIAIRTALGAGRARLIRQFLTESVLLSVAGGALGLLLAKWGLDGLLALAANFLPRANEIGIDWTVAGFTLLLSLVTGVAFGLAPALQVSRTDVQEALKEGTGAGTSPHRNWVRSVLVVAEVASALVLLIGAGLLIKSFIRLQEVNTGLQPENVLTVKISLPAARYETTESARGFYKQLLDRAAAMPGVAAAGVVNMLPIAESGFNGPATVEGKPPLPPDQMPLTEYRSASADYFRALGIPLVAGRYFNEQDQDNNTPVAIVNQEFVRVFLPDQDPLGTRIGSGFSNFVTIVGVVRDVKQSGLTRPVRPEIFLPLTQAQLGMVRTQNLVLRSTTDPLEMTGAVRQAVQAIDPAQPIYNEATMDAVVAQSVSSQRLTMLLLTIFAALALTLAVIGIYSVMSYTVMQSTREIGIRMALGAQSSDVLKLMVGHGFLLAVFGVGVGLVASFALARLMTSLLFGVAPTDAVTFAGVALLLIAIAVLACYLPARRATKVDPLVALRYE